MAKHSANGIAKQAIWKILVIFELFPKMLTGAIKMLMAPGLPMSSLGLV